MSQTDVLTGLKGKAAVKLPCRAATTANITLEGEQTIDGVAVVADDRVLVKNQTDGTENGIYIASTSAWQRAPDADGANDFVTGSLVLVTAGTVSAGLMYELTTTGTITPGTTSLTFALYNAGGVITAIPVTLAQGGTGQITAAAALGALGVAQVTAEAGTANAQTGTIPASVTAYAAEQLFIFTPSVANTGATTLTLTPSGAAALAAKNIFANGAALVGGELQASVPVILQYDGTQFNIIGHYAPPTLVALATPDRATDHVFWVFDTSAGVYKKVLLQELPYPRGYIDGCVMSNNSTDPTNDIDIAAGECRDSTNAKNIHCAAMTKRLDAAWAEGTGQGFRDSAAAIANDTYHVYAVAKDDGTQDYYATTATTAAAALTALQLEAGGTNYIYARRIFSILRESAALVGITQVGDHFYRKVPVSEWADTNPGTSRLTKTIKVPTDLKVLAKVTITIADHSQAADMYGIVNSPDHADTAPATGNYNMALIGVSSGHMAAMFSREVLTNTSAQISYRLNQSASDIYGWGASEGWIDRRGKDA